MTNSNTSAWPGQVIHVNEDGWVLINRGTRHGAVPALRLLVVGEGIRPLRDLFADASADENAVPLLRIRRTYELLEIIYAEDDCAVAIAARAPRERRPTVYRGPQGELLVWTPLPPTYTYQLPETTADPTDDTDPEYAAESASDDESAPDFAAESANPTDEEGQSAAESASPDAEDDIDLPPQTAEQEDKRWEEALPLNGTAVGDLVVPALPATPGASPSASAAAPSASSTPSPANPYEAGRAYDWMQPKQE